MEDWRRPIVDTYNNSAEQLAEYFRGIGPRTKYIDLGFELAGKPQNARVLEVGCGDGRDAKEIVKRAGDYIGVDISENLINLAREHVPDARFEVANIAEYEFPEDLDIIFSFASLLHSPRDEVADVLQRAHPALKPGGIFYISLKERPEYAEEWQQDQYGERKFFYYTPELVAELAGDRYEVAMTLREKRGHTDWFELALRNS